MGEYNHQVRIISIQEDYAEIILVIIGLVSLPLLAWYHGFMTAVEGMTSFLID